MLATVDLELNLRRRDSERYALDLRLVLPKSEAETRPLEKHVAIITIDQARLHELAVDPVAYGRALGEMLFCDARVRAEFTRARTVAQNQQLPLRLRLAFEGDASDLHGLNWESIRDPQDDIALGFSPHVWLSRFLASADWSEVTLRARSELRALVVIASPSDLGVYRLAAVDVERHRRVAEDGLKLARTTFLAGERRPTLDAITDVLREPCDIFYLVAHGSMIDGEPWLWLEDENGGSARVSGDEVARRFAELPQRPRLAVLISCASAGAGDERALAALGPRLAEAGVPAVVAMQGLLSLPTAWVFLTKLIAELNTDGCIDRAVTLARGAIRARPDAYAPVLYTRLKTGRIWYVPGFAGDAAGFEQWPSLARAVLDSECTPILGFGLLESYIGSSRALARQWADRHGFPLSPTIREDLPQVAQFLASDQNYTYMRAELRETLRDELLQRFGDALPPALTEPSVPLNDLLQAAGELRAGLDPAEPHRMLARLPFSLYLTTNPDNLLERALYRAGRAPEVLTCPWYPTEVNFAPKPEEPTRERPMVYHLFGHLAEPKSLVVTEDDYFRYLKGVTRNNALIPEVVRHNLAESSLLFLGFRLDEWNFRVFLRSVMNDEVFNRIRLHTHVAVQLDLDESRIAQPERARRYFEKHLGHDNLSIFWGSAEEFIRELGQRVDALAPSRR